MQQLVKVKEVYRVYVSGKPRFSENAEPATCSLEKNYSVLPMEHSYLFGDYQPITCKSIDNRMTDIMVYDPNAALSLDEIILKYARKEEVQNTVEPHTSQNQQSGQRTLQETQLLDDALKVCTAYRENWDKFQYQKKEPRLKLNNINEENLENFLNESVPLVAFDIYNIINMLISLEGMRKSSFPGYEELYKKICEEFVDTKVRAMDTRKLAMLLEAKIPATTKFKTTHTITPVINAKTTGTNDMMQFKQSRMG